MQRDFDRQELNLVFSKVQRHKAVGPDKIYNYMLVEGYSVFADVLLKIYNLCWSCEYTPKLWCVSDYVPMLKPGRSDDDVQNYRPLQVSSQLARTLAALVSNRLLAYCARTPNCQLNYWNMAFQPNKSIDDMLAAIVNDAYYARAHHSNINLVTTDISGCYDSVHLESLIVKLFDQFGLNGRILNWIYNNLSLRWTRVLVNHTVGSLSCVRDGLPQGHTLSPILAVMFTNDYKQIHPRTINIGAFVDDFNFWQNLQTYTSTPLTSILQESDAYSTDVHLQNEVTNFENWCHFWQFDVSARKSEQLFIQFAPNFAPATIFINKLRLTPITKASTVSKYSTTVTPCLRVLGLYIDPGLTWKSHIQHVSHVANYRLLQLRQIVSRFRWQWRGMTVWRLYQATIQPILEHNAIFYCSALNFSQSSNVICKIWKSAMTLASGLPFKGIATLKLQKILAARHPFSYIYPKACAILFKVQTCTS